MDTNPYHSPAAPDDPSHASESKLGSSFQLHWASVVGLVVLSCVVAQIVTPADEFTTLIAWGPILVAMLVVYAHGFRKGRKQF